MTILLFLFYFLSPLLILYLCHKYTVLNKIGSVVLAYITGLILGNVGIFPRGSEAFINILTGNSYIANDKAAELLSQGIIQQSDVILNQIAFTQDLIMTLVIPLSIPLLLFSLDLRKSLTNLKTGLLSLVIAIVSLMICVVIGHLLFADHIDESWKISGMMVGLYTGGTPNLAALATALEVKPNMFIITHTYDLMMGVILLLFFITIAQRLFNRILPHFKESTRHKAPCRVVQETKGIDNFIDYFNKKTLWPVLAALGISLLIFAIGGALSLLVPSESQMVVVILTITTLGIAVSLIPRINKIEKTFELGMYLILIFSVVVASMADVRSLWQIDFIHLFLYVILAVFGSMIVHVILSALFKIDTDTTIITITALSTSPPFVPVVAGALKNKNIILMGITIGVIGYAIGNYLGIFTAYFLKNF